MLDVCPQLLLCRAAAVAAVDQSRDVEVAGVDCPVAAARGVGRVAAPQPRLLRRGN